jgi:hypothetical protein
LYFETPRLQSILRRFFKFVAGQYRRNVSTWFLVKGVEFNKLKFTVELAAMAHRWGGWSTLGPGRFIPGKDPVPIVWEAGWAPGPFWTGAENLPRRDSIPGLSSP